MEKHCGLNKRHEFFGFGWQFHYGDLSVSDAEKGGQGFYDVTLPHDWLMDYEAPDKDPVTQAMNWKYGVGMYRKEFYLDAAAAGRTLKLLFDGAYQDATVYLNGVKLGNNFYGYIPFELDATAAARPGETNIIVVRVDNSCQPNTRWYSGSGITRDVWISSLDPVHVANDGTYIVTETIDNGIGVVRLSTEIDNDSDVDQKVDVTSKIYGPDGRLWAALPETIILGAGSKCTVIEQKVALKDPMLWAPAHPNMYKCVTVIEKDGAVIDEYVSPFGIRTIKFDAMGGFFINGEHLKINGMAIHNDAGQLGAAVPVKVWKRRLQRLKDMGCNAIRTAHNPSDPLIMDLMDEMGLMCMDEFFDEWTICKWSKSRGNPDYPPHGYAEHYAELHVKDAETIIRRDRNHPSVILWSVGNECEEVYAVDGFEVMKELAEICHRMDPTRPVTEGTNLLAHNSKYTYEKFMEYQDVKGMNWFNIWLDRAELFYEPDKINHPDWPMVVTETGGISGSRGKYPLPPRRGQAGGSPFRSKGYYAWPVETSKHIRFIETRDYMSGVFFWTGVAYMGESTYPNRGGNHAPVDLAGFINDNWYFYRSVWKRDVPTVRLLPHWNMESEGVEVGQVIPVICYTSCPSVELFLNGKSYGEKAYLYPAKGIDFWPNFDLTKPAANTDDLFLQWDVPFEPGELVAVGYDREGNELERHTVRTVGAAAQIKVDCDEESLAADGRDICHIEISLLDKDGNFAILSDDELTVNVTGAGKLLAMDNSDPQDHTMGRVNKRKAFYGLLMAVVQADREPGTVKVEVSAKGMETKVIEIEVK